MEEKEQTLQLYYLTESPQSLMFTTMPVSFTTKIVFF